MGEDPLLSEILAVWGGVWSRAKNRPKICMLSCPQHRARRKEMEQEKKPYKDLQWLTASFFLQSYLGYCVSCELSLTALNCPSNRQADGIATGREGDTWVKVCLCSFQVFKILFKRDCTNISLEFPDVLLHAYIKHPISPWIHSSGFTQSTLRACFKVWLLNEWGSSIF